MSYTQRGGLEAGGGGGGRRGGGPPPPPRAPRARGGPLRRHVPRAAANARRRALSGVGNGDAGFNPRLCPEYFLPALRAACPEPRLAARVTCCPVPITV
mgnify:CR=1 FL=1